MKTTAETLTLFQVYAIEDESREAGDLELADDCRLLTLVCHIAGGEDTNFDEYAAEHGGDLREAVDRVVSYINRIEAFSYQAPDDNSDVCGFHANGGRGRCSYCEDSE